MKLYKSIRKVPSLLLLWGTNIRWHSEREPSKDNFTKDKLRLARWFQWSKLKCEFMTEDGRQMMKKLAWPLRAKKWRERPTLKCKSLMKYFMYIDTDIFTVNLCFIFTCTEADKLLETYKQGLTVFLFLSSIVAVSSYRLLIFSIHPVCGLDWKIRVNKFRVILKRFSTYFL